MSPQDPIATARIRDRVAAAAERFVVPKTADLVASDLRRRIVEGQFAVSGQLPQATSLAETYRISRPTLKEALQVLESERLITPDPQRRAAYRVLSPSASTAARHAGLLLQLSGSTTADLAGARAVLDTQAGHLVADRVAPDPLRHHLDADPDTFHRAVAEHSGSATLGTFQGVVDGIYMLFVASPPAWCTAPDAHAHYVNLLDSGDARSASRLWREHCRSLHQSASERPNSRRLQEVDDDELAELSAPRRVARLIRTAIVSGMLQPGDRLPTEELLRREHRVSRVALREGLRILETEGLLRVQRGARGGATVARPSPVIAARYVGILLHAGGVSRSDFFAVRALIETEFVTYAAQTPAPMGALHALLALEEEQLPRPREFGHTAVAFHQALADRGGSPAMSLLFALMEQVMHLAAEAELTAATSHERLAAAHADHVQLVRLVEAGDDAAARGLWARHCRGNHQSLPDERLDFFAMSRAATRRDPRDR